jgi:hypothetical protein
MRSHNKLRTFAFTTTIAIVGIASSSWIIGCAGNDGGKASDNLGTGSIKLVLAGGDATFATFSYSITGPFGFSKTGSLDVSASSTLSGVIGGLPVGGGFSISLSGTSLDGDTQCAGSASFSVAAHGTTPVTIALDCHPPPSQPVQPAQPVLAPTVFVAPPPALTLPPQPARPSAP